LKQNASAVISPVAAGETITVTDRGREVAQIILVPAGPLDRPVAAGQARLAEGSLAALGDPPPAKTGRRPLSAVLAEMLDEERC
jgi:antitoxin (DNA-binding transcriptional repressor) of toxin-antitoxin stability system